MVKLKQVDVRSMLKSMGIKWANVSPARLDTKLNDEEVIKKLLEDGEDPSGKDLEILKVIAKAVDDGEEITVIPEVDSEETEESTTAEVKGKKEKIAKEKKVSPPRGPRENADRFGSRPETTPGKINAQINSTPQTVDDIAKAAGVGKARVATHLEWLKSKELVVEEKKGWREAKKVKAKV